MKKILLIEDNPEIRENTGEILALANYDVLTAENGKVGVELAQQNLPHLIICDIMMPELDGYGVLNILSKNPETARIPFIFLTAKTEKVDMRKGMEMGADDYLTKPFDDNDLLNAIQTRLRKTELFAKNYDTSSDGLDHFIKDAQEALDFEDLCKDKKVKQYKKKHEIFVEGDSPSSVFYVKKGTIKTFRTHPDGKELITNLYRETEFFGFEPILENTAYQESCMAMEDSELVIIPKSDFLTLIYQHHDVSRSFISLLCKKVSEKEKHLLHLAYNSVRQRTAESLLRIHELRGKEQELIVIPREDLAKMVGTAAESVIRVLSDFKDEGLIDIISGKIKILEERKLDQVVKWNFVRK